MHIAEGFLPLAHCVAWTAVSAPFAVQGFRRVAVELRGGPKQRLMLAASGGFLFTLTALKLPSVAGSSSHPTGVSLAALAYGPPVTTALAAIVLIFQALLLAHGGITTLGANLFSLGVAGPWAFCAAVHLFGRHRRSDWRPVRHSTLHPRNAGRTAAAQATIAARPAAAGHRCRDRPG